MVLGKEAVEGEAVETEGWGRAWFPSPLGGEAALRAQEGWEGGELSPSPLPHLDWSKVRTRTRQAHVFSCRGLSTQPHSLSSRAGRLLWVG